jgi:hypothetical protein
MVKSIRYEARIKGTERNKEKYKWSLPFRFSKKSFYAFFKSLMCAT